MRFIPHIRLSVLPLALLVLLATAGAAGSAATTDVKPFSYSYVVTSVTATGTYTINGATAVINVHMTQPTKKIQMSWRGKRDGSMLNGSSGSSITFTGQAVFTDPGMPSCNKTFPITSAGSHPGVSIILGYARERVVTHPIFDAIVGRFPMVTGYPGSENKCGLVRKDWWETAHGSWPFPAIVKKKSFTLHDTQPKRDLGDGESVEWTLDMTVRKVRFIPISCQKAKGC